METVLGKYIAGHFCSFLRISTVPCPYYVVTIDVSYKRVVSVRLVKNAEGKWHLEAQPDEPVVNEILDALTAVVEANEV
jgi:hypothetical protein